MAILSNTTWDLLKPHSDAHLAPDHHRIHHPLWLTTSSLHSSYSQILTSFALLQGSTYLHLQKISEAGLTPTTVCWWHSLFAFQCGELSTSFGRFQRCWIQLSSVKCGLKVCMKIAAGGLWSPLSWSFPQFHSIWPFSHL